MTYASKSLPSAHRARSYVPRAPAGNGPDAVFAPEMVAFARSLGFAFMAHRLNDPNRKARIERPFSWIEGNFLPDRRFDSFEDVNAQARRWCVEVANAKTKRSLGMPPEAAYVLEKPHLAGLPALLPSVYEVFERVVDLYGDYDRSPFDDARSPVMIWVLERPSAPDERRSR